MRQGASKARTRVLKPKELKSIWNAASEVGYPYGAIVQFAALTLQRPGTSNPPGEVAGLPKAEIDLKSREWTLPDERCKSGRGHVVPLTDMMIKLIRALPVFDGPYLFSVTMGESRFNSFGRAKIRLDKIAKVPDVMVKDLRRAGATVMRKNLGITEYVVGAVLNHVRAMWKSRH